MHAISLTQAQFDALPEYSLSLPDDTTTGKRWKRRVPPRGQVAYWALGEYGRMNPHTKTIEIIWFRIVIVDEAQNGDGDPC